MLKEVPLTETVFEGFIVSGLKMLSANTRVPLNPPTNFF